MIGKIVRISILAMALIAANFIAQPVPASAHRDGCHRWHSCPSDSGSYVCGDLGYYSECPSAAPAPAPKVIAPKVTTKVLTTDEGIPYGSSTRWTSREYRGYEQVAQQGANGLKRLYHTVTYTNGTETSRALTNSEVMTQPVEQVTIKGRRTLPQASVDKIARAKNDRITVKGAYKPNKEVVLSVDGKRIKRAKTNAQGKFVFEDIKASSQKHTIQIYKRENRKEHYVSEKFYLDANANTFISDYDKIHGTTPPSAQTSAKPKVVAASAVKPEAKPQSCDPNYSGCVPIASDVDCQGGTGNGPAYIRGPLKVTGTDIYKLDADKDGTACE